MIKTQIAGIPCQVELVNGYYQQPNPGTWDSDLDYYGGWFDVEFEVYDTKGYRAKWLEKKLTEADEERILDLLTRGLGRDDCDD